MWPMQDTAHENAKEPDYQRHAMYCFPVDFQGDILHTNIREKVLRQVTMIRLKQGSWLQAMFLQAKKFLHINMPITSNFI